MPRKKRPVLTCRSKAAILKDEREAVKMYRDMGFPKQAADEAAHLVFFKKQPCKR